MDRKIAENRELVERRLFQEATLEELGIELGVSKDRARSVLKSATLTLAEVVAENPRFSDFPMSKRVNALSSTSIN